MSESSCMHVCVVWVCGVSVCACAVWVCVSLWYECVVCVWCECVCLVSVCVCVCAKQLVRVCSLQHFKWKAWVTHWYCFLEMYFLERAVFPWYYTVIFLSVVWWRTGYIDKSTDWKKRIHVHNTNNVFRFLKFLMQTLFVCKLLIQITQTVISRITVFST